MRRAPAGVDRLPENVRVDAALEALDPRDRHVLALLLMERLTPLEVAGALRMTVRQVEQAFELALGRVAAEAVAARPRRAARRVA